MQTRLDYRKANPHALNAMLALEERIAQSGLEPTLIELVRLRASQINGCAYCVDMHTRDARKHGETERHLNAVAGWREAPFFDARERAALQWAESVARIPHTDPSDEAFAHLQAHFSDAEIVELGFAIATINAWNLLNVSFRNPIPETV